MCSGSRTGHSRFTAGLPRRTGRCSCGRWRLFGTWPGDRRPVPRHRGRPGRRLGRRRSSRSATPPWPTTVRVVRPGSATRWSSTSTRTRSRTTARAAASSRTAVRSLRRRRAGWPVTPPLSGTAVRHGRFRRRCGGRCAPAIVAVAFLAARTGVSSMPITSTTGHGAGRPGWTTCCCSAAVIIGSSTRAATGSTGTAASSTPEDNLSPPRRPCPAAARNSCSMATARSRSTHIPARPARATR
jgi:hypothetical protein